MTGTSILSGGSEQTGRPACGRTCATNARDQSAGGDRVPAQRPGLQGQDHRDSCGGWLQYCDPSHTGGEEPVWTSDQGFNPSERYVAYDLDLVLRVTRYYAEHGQLDPSVRWEE